MTPEQWPRVKEVFEAALDHAPEERPAFLAQACGDDVMLCSEVQSLLRSYEQEKGFMETPAVALAAQSLVGQERAALVGRQLGHYRIIRELGRGGMGVVYLAQDVSLDRPVALKLLPIHLTSEPERLHRFEQEARAASALNHPNILTIHEIGEIDGLRFIETEFIDGVTLRERIKSRELKPSDTLSIAEQIASALAAAHKAGIVHRDIKPENVMLRRDGYVKVLDFGVAKLTEEQAVKVDNGSAMTLGVNSNTGIVGTAGYMSPEQAKGKHVDQRSDIFSFGAVLYEMLTGEMAFQGKSDADKLQAITSEWPADLSGLRESVPADLDQVLQRCLEKEPEHRYENGTVLVEALKELGAPWRSTAEVPVSGRASWTGSNRWWWMVLAGMGLIISVSLWLRIPEGSPGKMSNQAAEALSRDLTTIPLTGLPGVEGFPKFSPDDRYVAYAGKAEGSDNEEIYIKLIDGGKPLRLTTNPDSDTSPVWSPDGHSIAFIRSSEKERAIVTIPAIGGPERKLLSANVAVLLGKQNFGRIIDWSPDGKFIVYSDASVAQTPLGLYRLSVETRETQQLTVPPATLVGGDQQPAFSPDGQNLAFVRMFDWGAHDIYVMPTGGGEAKRLTFDYRFVFGLTWTPDGRSIVFASYRRGTTDLWRISAAGGKPERLGINGAFPALSLHGQMLAYVAESGGANSMWRINLSDSPGRTGSRIKVLSTTTKEINPQISPDGKKIVFSSDRSGANEIWVCESDGSNLLQLTKVGHISGTPRWSPDGRYLAFDSRPEEEPSDIYVIEANGGVPRRLTEDPAEDATPSWSRDGRWIYFASKRSGDQQVWKMPASGGEAVRVTQHGGLAPFESPDGKYVYYAKGLVNPSLWCVPVQGGEESLVLDRVGSWAVWAVVDDGIYFEDSDGQSGEVIEFFSFATRRVTKVAAIAKPGIGLAVSPDERWLVCLQNEEGSSKVMLVNNFR